MAAGTEGEQRTALAARMDGAARKLAEQLPDPGRAEQQLAALKDVKDNKVAAALHSALALGASSEVRRVPRAPWGVGPGPGARVRMREGTDYRVSAEQASWSHFPSGGARRRSGLSCNHCCLTCALDPPWPVAAP
jgi:hypothetical protein